MAKRGARRRVYKAARSAAPGQSGVGSRRVWVSVRRATSIMNSYVVTAAVCCLAIGACVSSLPQHKFAHNPVHFSFRTVHTPATLSHPFTSFTNPARPVQGPFQPALVPVVVPVPKDFVGDAIVVTEDQLPTLGLAHSVAGNGIEPSSPAVNAVSAGPLSAVDQSFSLSAKPQITEPAVENTGAQQEPAAESSVVEQEPAVENTVAQEEPAVENTAPQEETVVEDTVPQQEPAAENTVAQEVPAVESNVVQEEPAVVVQEEAGTLQAPSGAVSPFETSTFKAYNNFINTWLRLASVNLNRPDILNLVREGPIHQPAPQTQTTAPPAPLVTESPKVQPENPLEVSTPEPGIDEVSSPQDTATTISEMSTSIVEVTPTPATAPVQEITHDLTAGEKVLGPTGVQSTPQEPEVIQENAFAVPRFTSRGRLSGFRYRFSHVPQSGAFFFNSLTG